MSDRVVRIMLVEDDPMQRRLMAHHLKGIKGYQFEIGYAESEDAAVEAMARGRVELVVLDYHLTQGDGLSCLRRMRQLDTFVPIIAVSGTATPEIAAELLRAGADDFFDKHQLTGAVVVQSVRDALARADAWYEQARKLGPPPSAELNELFQTICRRYVETMGPDFLKQLELFETKARQAKLSLGQLTHLLETFGGQMDSASASADRLPARRVLRPVFLEIALRLFGEGTPE